MKKLTSLASLVLIAVFAGSVLPGCSPTASSPAAAFDPKAPGLGQPRAYFNNKYGEDGSADTWRDGGMAIYVDFIDGKAACIFYSFTDDRSFTPVMRQASLDANGTNWTLHSEDRWKSSEGYTATFYGTMADFRTPEQEKQEEYALLRVPKF